jgi:hypothetical protein
VTAPRAGRSTRAAHGRAAPVVLVTAACGALVAIAFACGGARPKAAASAPSAQSTEDPRAQSGPRAEIEALDREIADDIAKAHLPPPQAAPCSGAACAAAMSAPFVTPTTTDLQCRPAAAQRCTDLCTLSTSICNNQQKICDLAKQLPGDDWAANKCESARASCKAANDACCTCLG